MATFFKHKGGKNWIIQYFDHAGKRRTKSSKTTDKRAAERIANKLEADAALRLEGVVDPAMESVANQSSRTIKAHLEGFKAKLQAAGRTEKHITSTRNYITWIAEFAGFETAADITSDGVIRYAGKLCDEGRSSRTIQAYLTAMKSFTKWLYDHHKMPRDPLTSIKRPNPKNGRRLERRMLLPEEWHLLKAATLDGKEAHGMSPLERALLYETSARQAA